MVKSKETIREYLGALAIAVAAALVLRIFVVQAFRIPTGSMKDTLLVGDFLLVNKFVFGVRTPDHLPLLQIKIPHGRLPAIRQPRHGDILVFKFPDDPSIDYIKRCIGLPGDTILIVDNQVFINGQPEGAAAEVDKRFDQEEHATFTYYQMVNSTGKKYLVRKLTNNRNRLKEYGPIVVPPDHYFMMGDNRDNSSDSRTWGCLPQDLVVGKAMLIYFSFDQKRVHPSWKVLSAIRWHRLFNLIR